MLPARQVGATGRSDGVHVGQDEGHKSTKLACAVSSPSAVHNDEVHLRQLAAALERHDMHKLYSRAMRWRALYVCCTQVPRYLSTPARRLLGSAVLDSGERLERPSLET